MKFPYHSFLVCDHGSHTDIYLNGISVGQIKNGKFEIRQVVLTDGTKVNFSVKQIPDSPFKNLKELSIAMEKFTEIMFLFKEPNGGPENEIQGVISENTVAN